jgi:phosphoesterase RecJ-like protein
MSGPTAIASARNWAWRWRCASRARRVVCWNEDPCRKNTPFWIRQCRAKARSRPPEFDLVIAVDCASFERLGTFGPAVAQRKCLINIDHHQSNTRYGDLNWISAREASTGELIFRCCKAPAGPSLPAIADCLFTAVSTDTGSFQYPPPSR